MRTFFQYLREELVRLLMEAAGCAALFGLLWMGLVFGHAMGLQ